MSDAARGVPEDFPAEPGEILSARGRRLIEPDGKARPRLAVADHAVFLGDSIDPEGASRCLRVLESRIGPLLREERARMPHDPLTGRISYEGGSLPLTARARIGALRRSEPKLYEAAKRCGLLSFMYSDQMLAIAEAVTGMRLAPRRVLISAGRYGPGDYVGHHHDWAPGRPERYVVLIVSLASSEVDQQLYVFEQDGFMSGTFDVSSSGLMVAHVPRWHLVTPLRGKPGARDGEVYRWILAQGFEIAGPAAA